MLKMPLEPHFLSSTLLFFPVYYSISVKSNSSHLDLCVILIFISYPTSESVGTNIKMYLESFFFSSYLPLTPWINSSSFLAWIILVAYWQSASTFATFYLHCWQIVPLKHRADIFSSLLVTPKYSNNLLSHS